MLLLLSILINILVADVSTSCIRILGYLQQKYQIGDKITLTSKSGNTYIGIYRGQLNGYIRLELEGGKINLVAPHRLSDDNVPADVPWPTISTPQAKATPVPENLIQKIKNSETQKIAREFFDKLPEKKVLSDDKIPNVGMIKFLWAERLLVLKDPSLDPVLVNWLRTIQQKFPPDKENFLRAKGIAKFVEQTFNNKVNVLLHPIRTIKFKSKLNNVDGVKLGEFIHNKHGNCRHNAVALQLALQEAGIESKYVTGDVFDNKLKTKGRHAWVEIKDDKGIEHILDSSLGIYARASSIDRYTYTPRDKGIEIPVNITKSDFEDLLPYLFR